MENNLCSVKRKHFDEIFKEYFRSEDITEDIEIDKELLYSNYEIIKIHLNEPYNFDKLLNKIFNYITIFSGEKFNEYTDNENKYEESLDYLKQYFDEYESELENLTNEDLDDPKIRGKVSGLKEVGEILLFFLNEGLLNAPIVISKLRTKTSKKMPVFGADGIHLSSDHKELYFGEAKLNNKFSNGKIQSRDSISGFNNDKSLLKFELKVITSQLKNIPKKNSIIINELINPYHNKKEEIKKLPYSITCLLGYEDEDYKNFIIDSDKNKYDSKLSNKIKGLLKYYKINETELENKKIIFFMLPFLDMLSFLKKYSKKLKEPEILKEIKN